MVGITMDKSTGKYITDRLAVQQKFINFAICNNLVTESDHNYHLNTVPYLKLCIG